MASPHAREVRRHPQEARASFPPELRSAAAARHFAEAVLAEMDLPSALDVTRLLVSELVVNAVVHAESEAQVVLHHDGARLRVEVLDDSTTLPVVRGHSPTVPDGRGLRILDGLADRWGVDVTDGGKAVWFELVVESIDEHEAVGRPVSGNGS